MKPEPLPEQPIKWLIRELQAYLTEQQWLDLMAGYNAVKRRYDTASKFRLAKQELALFQRNQSLYGPDTARYKSYTVKISRRLERIKKLEEELNA